MKQSPEVVFSLKTTDGKEVSLDFDDVDFICQSVQLTYTRLFPDVPFTDEEQSNAAFKRSLAKDYADKFIPDLQERFKKELGHSFSAGKMDNLYNKYRAYRVSLKKSTEDDQSSACSTDSTASTSPTNTQPPSLSDSTKPSSTTDSSCSPVEEPQPPTPSVKHSF